MALDVLPHEVAGMPAEVLQFLAYKAGKREAQQAVAKGEAYDPDA